MLIFMYGKYLNNYKPTSILYKSTATQYFKLIYALNILKEYINNDKTTLNGLILKSILDGNLTNFYTNSFEGNDDIIKSVNNNISNNFNDNDENDFYNQINFIFKENITLLTNEILSSNNSDSSYIYIK